MPNIKSAMKRVKIIKTKTLRNQMVKTSLKTSIKKFESSVDEGNIEKATTAFRMAVKKIDQSVAKGVLHKNTAARKKAQLNKKLKSISA
ncbi:MAG: 30S ribosomal protein S20 [Firmicutes bacterium]|nr:30S ribosomal protein S20 [Bacillota bacterium]